MAAAGDYDRRLEWRQRVAGTPDAFGQKPGTRRFLDLNPNYPSQGFLWGAVENWTANRATEKESERQKDTATIRLRNFPGVSPGDQLVDSLGFCWTIDTAVLGDNEVICDVSR